MMATALTLLQNGGQKAEAGPACKKEDEAYIVSTIPFDLGLVGWISSLNPHSDPTNAG